MDKNNIWFLFNRPRAEKSRQVLAGQWPKDNLYAFNEIKKLHWNADFSDRGHERNFFRKAFTRIEDILSNKGKYVGFNLPQALALKSEMEKSDVVFATADSSALGALALKSAGKLSTPVVYATIGMVEGFDERETIKKRAYRRLLRKAVKIIYYGKGEGERLKHLFSLPEESLQFVPFGIDTAFFQGEIAKRNAPPLALGIDPRRDWRLLCDSVRDSGIGIDLICNKDMLKGIDVPANVYVGDPLPMHELRKKIARASFVILPVKPNTYTGATITLLQCMAAGCPVIVSRTEAITDGYHLEHEGNCLLVKPGNKNELAGAIDALYGDERFCCKLGEGARLTADRYYGIGKYALHLDAIFRKVIG